MFHLSHLEKLKEYDNMQKITTAFTQLKIFWDHFIVLKQGSREQGSNKDGKKEREEKNKALC